ncbi:glycosyltransferase family 8 protein [uncultured Tolumonas sp.]|uniref:glycosyltransferase family 8 protein n=1 Tax=uncultured Tolumonas sp. TaxID=263765 RepID=UPI0029304203|nr:glycosyltransferase family 8 protein [uncultured Tolumonas sp.]
MKKHIALNIDKNYVNYCCILIKSFIHHNNELHFHILNNDLNSENQSKIQNIVEGTDSVISFHFVNDNRFDGFPVSNQWPTAIYYRLLIPELLPAELEKVLYCDCDVMIRGSIDELWDIDLTGYGVAAVEDVLSPITPMIEQLGCDPEFGYFNSGVMLINLSFWRENNISELALSYLQSNLDKIKHPDQDALNFVLNKHWYRLHYKWNFLSTYQNLYYDKNHLLADYNKTINNYPKIIHFSGVKPWNSKCRSIFKYEYIKFSNDAKLNINFSRHSSMEYIRHFALLLLDRMKLKKCSVNYYF